MTMPNPPPRDNSFLFIHSHLQELFLYHKENNSSTLFEDFQRIVKTSIIVGIPFLDAAFPLLSL